MSKELDAWERIRFYSPFEEENNIVETAFEALEIIKKKGVNLYKLKICDSVEEYNKLCNSDLPLVQVEYDLLKEVLL